MITGRGPGAPGVTPGLEFTRRRAAAGGTGGQAVDLGEIRRSEEAINVLAARGAAGPQLRHDPVLALLGAPSQGAAAWLRAAVAGGVVAGLASITSLIATTMLARLGRGPARGARWGQRPARRGRVR